MDKLGGSKEKEAQCVQVLQLQHGVVVVVVVVDDAVRDPKYIKIGIYEASKATYWRVHD